MSNTIDISSIFDVNEGCFLVQLKLGEKEFKMTLEEAERCANVIMDVVDEAKCKTEKYLVPFLENYHERLENIVDCKKNSFKLKAN